jgi:terminase large subunit-like protein
MAGNQLGKTLAGGFEAAMHATGRYPDDWKGKRFDRPTVGWACGVTGEVVRDTVQKILVGRVGQEGTGAIPKDAIAELVSARGIPELLDTIKVKHLSGGHSIIGLKTYASGREKFQGETLDWVWFDEEPPADIYTEGLTRTVGVAARWEQGDARRGRCRLGQPIQGPGSKYAARICALSGRRNKKRICRGRADGHAPANAVGALQSLQASPRLV